MYILYVLLMYVHYCSHIHRNLHSFPTRRSSDLEENKLFLQIIQSLIIVLIIWGFFNLASATSLLFSKINRKTNMHIDLILIPFILRGISVIIVAILIIIFTEFFC